jgi:hypothetical protein
MALSIKEIKKKKKSLNKEIDSSSQLMDRTEESKVLRPWESFKKEKDLLQMITEKKGLESKETIKKDFNKFLLVEKEKKKVRRTKKVEELERNKRKGISPELENKLKKISKDFFSKEEKNKEI